MKLYLSSLFLLTIILSGCCFSDSENPESLIHDKQPSYSDTSTAVVTEPKVIPIDERDDLNPQAKETMKSRMEASPFSNLGCCEEEKKQVEKCCCSEVLKAYERMLESGDERLAKLNMEDPILSNCKNGLLSKDFERLDFPVDDGEDIW